MARILKSIYYNLNHPASLGGVKRLEEASKLPRSEVLRWLMSQEAYTLHKPVRLHFSRRKTLALHQNELWQCDLVSVNNLSRYNRGIKYLLTIIDVFSKFAYVVPLKNKTKNTMFIAFSHVFKLAKPKMLQTDRGKEFYNKPLRELFEKMGINHYSTYTETKASVVERFNKSLKIKLYRLFTFRKSFKYIDVLSNIVKSYNNSIHRSTGMSPSSIKPKHHSIIFKKLYGVKGKVKYKFEINDYVRISKARKTFSRGYLPGWTREVFTIYSRFPTNPPTYELSDLNGEILKGRFYTEELQKINNG